MGSTGSISVSDYPFVINGSAIIGLSGASSNTQMLQTTNVSNAGNLTVTDPGQSVGYNFYSPENISIESMDSQSAQQIAQLCALSDGTLVRCPTAPTPTGTGGGTVGNIPPTLIGASVSRTASVRFTPCHDSELDTFLATRTGGSGTISYQWQVASSTSTQQPSTYSNVGTNSSTFTLNLPYYVSGSRTNYAVRVRITDSGSGPIQGNTVTSSPFYTHNELNPGNSISPACPV